MRAITGGGTSGMPNPGPGRGGNGLWQPKPRASRQPTTGQSVRPRRARSRSRSPEAAPGSLDMDAMFAVSYRSDTQRFAGGIRSPDIKEFGRGPQSRYVVAAEGSPNYARTVSGNNMHTLPGPQTCHSPSSADRPLSSTFALQPRDDNLPAAGRSKR